jgi:hypothetical protein
MNDLTSIAVTTRTLVNDDEQTGNDVFVYTSSSVFTLTEKNVNAISSVMVNGTESGVTYTEDLATSRVSITSNLNVDDVVDITYTCYSNYSTSEIYGYIKSAIVHLCVNNGGTFTLDGTDIYPEPTASESNLIALVASILIDPKNISYRMPDIAVSVPKDLNTNDKIRKVIAIYKKDSTGLMFIAEDYPSEVI